MSRNHSIHAHAKDYLFGGACALALALAVASTQWHPGLRDALAGWLAAVLQAYAARQIHRRAVASSSPYFLAWSLGSIIARTGFVLVLLALVRRTECLQFAPFAMALMLSYFVMLFTEVARLHLDSLAPTQTADSRL